MARDPSANGVRRKVFSDDASRSDDTPLSDVYSGRDDTACTDPYIVLDYYVCVIIILLDHGCVGEVCSMVECKNHDIRSCLDIVSDSHMSDGFAALYDIVVVDQTIRSDRNSFSVTNQCCRVDFCFATYFSSSLSKRMVYLVISEYFSQINESLQSQI